MLAFNLLVSIAIVGGIVSWQRVSRNAAGTTLLTARRLGWLVIGVWTTVWIVNVSGVSGSAGILDHFWYFTAIAGLCPLVSVLGSRRPIDSAWNGFVLIPMIVVLGWPALSQLMQTSHEQRLELQTPAVIGYLLVLVMGTGNYFGTRFTVPAILYGASLAILVVPLATLGSGRGPWLDHIRTGATVLAAIAMAMAGRSVSFAAIGEPSIDRAWIDFRDLFGIVWAKRAMDRLNQFAARESWPVVMTMDGLTPPPRSADVVELSGADRHQVEKQFRWVMKRFVDPHWLEQRLGGDRSPASVEESGDGQDDG